MNLSFFKKSIAIAAMGLLVACGSDEDGHDHDDHTDAADASDASDADASDTTDLTDASDSSDPSDTSEDQPMPGFTLVDQNEISSTYEQAISFSDYAGEVSAWYFLHCT